MIQEIFGVHEHIKDMCRGFAKIGLAVAVELYARQGDVSKLTDIQQILAAANRVPDEQVVPGLDAAVAWAFDRAGYRPNPYWLRIPASGRSIRTARDC